MMSLRRVRALVVPSLPFIFLLLLAAPLAAQPHPGDEGLDPATSITAAEIGEHVEVLASDLFEGREAGTRGEDRAAAYIVSVLETCEGLQPDGPGGGWLQPFEVSHHRVTTTAHNVLARLPGSDPDLAHEILVVGAHYDHVGFGRSGNTLDPRVQDIHNGADDNASGSSVLLELATSLCASGRKTRRTILFQWYSAEELGLLGSRHWVKEPTHPIEDVAFMINMDMVGRLAGRTLVVGGTGTSPGLSELARGFCDELSLHMIDDPPGSAPSDNSSFYEAGVPCLFLFTGLHDDYHRATDDSHKVDLVGARDIGQLAERLLLALDARDTRPEFRSAPGTALLFTPRLYLGCALEDAGPPDPPGARVAVLVPDTPAARAGLREGDTIAAWDGQPVTGVADVEARLLPPVGEVQPVVLTVWRLLPADAVPQPGAATGQVETRESLELTLRPVIR